MGFEGGGGMPRNMASMGGRGHAKKYGFNGGEGRQNTLGKKRGSPKKIFQVLQRQHL